MQPSATFSERLQLTSSSSKPQQLIATKKRSRSPDILLGDQVELQPGVKRKPEKMQPVVKKIRTLAYRPAAMQAALDACVEAKVYLSSTNKVAFTSALEQLKANPELGGFFKDFPSFTFVSLRSAIGRVLGPIKLACMYVCVCMYVCMCVCVYVCMCA